MVKRQALLNFCAFLTFYDNTLFYKNTVANRITEIYNFFKNNARLKLLQDLESLRIQVIVLFEG